MPYWKHAIIYPAISWLVPRHSLSYHNSPHGESSGRGWSGASHTEPWRQRDIVKDCLACRSGNFLFKQLVCNKSILEVGECPAAEVRNGVHVTSTQHVHTNETDSNVTYCTSLKVYWNTIETNMKKKPWWPWVESWQWAVGPLAEVGKMSKYHTKKRGWVRYKTLLKWAGTGLEVLVIQGGGERLRPGISHSMPPLHPPKLPHRRSAGFMNTTERDLERHSPWYQLALTSRSSPGEFQIRHLHNIPALEINETFRQISAWCTAQSIETPTGSHYFGTIYSLKEQHERKATSSNVREFLSTSQRIRIDCNVEIVTSGWRPWISSNSSTKPGCEFC